MAGPTWNGPMDVFVTIKDHLDILADEMKSLQDENNALMGHINAVAKAKTAEDLMVAISNIPDDDQSPLIDLSTQAKVSAMKTHKEGGGR